METSETIDALGALAQPTRLAAFRHLIRRTPDGIAAGALATELGIPASTLSVHLGQLVAAGLVERRRASRNLFYSVRIDRVQGLLGILTDDGCAGRPETCLPLTALPRRPAATVPAARR